MKIFIINFIITITILTACGSGSKLPKFKDFPKRSAEFSVWFKCENDETHVCKNICLKYDKKNNCKDKKKNIEKLPIKTALRSGFVFISKTMFINLLQGK